MQILFHCSILQTSAIIHKLVHIKKNLELFTIEKAESPDGRKLDEQ